MPTYEYACTSCGHHLEVVQSFSDDPLTTCPSCGAPLRKVFGAVGIVLKGSGFYKTDSRSSSPGTKAGGDRSDAKAGTDGSSTKDSPAAKEPSAGSGGSSDGGGSSSASGSTGGSSSTAKAAAT
jgi:putative FmdB family regulatory protein